jgi:regulator of RNase E activity RraA
MVLEKPCFYLGVRLLKNWNKNYMLSEISVKVFRSGIKLVGPAETDIVGPIVTILCTYCTCHDIFITVIF